MALFRQSLVLILAFLFVFAVKLILPNITIPIIGVLIFSYIIFSHQKKSQVEIFTLTSLILILISSTGSLSSPLFFLLYFLSFGIVFVFEAKTVFVFTLLALILFAGEAFSAKDLGEIAKLSSLLLIAPLAFFFGQDFRKRAKLSQASKETANVIAQDVGKVLKEEKQVLKEKDVEKLNEILEKTEELREEAKE